MGIQGIQRKRETYLRFTPVNIRTCFEFTGVNSRVSSFASVGSWGCRSESVRKNLIIAACKQSAVHPWRCCCAASLDCIFASVPAKVVRFLWLQFQEGEKRRKVVVEGVEVALAYIALRCLTYQLLYTSFAFGLDQPGSLENPLEFPDFFPRHSIKGTGVKKKRREGK